MATEMETKVSNSNTTNLSRCGLLIDILNDVPEFYDGDTPRTLASGAVSTTYVDCRSLLSRHPQHLFDAAKLLAASILPGNQVCGVPEGATTLAALVVREADAPIAMLRSTPKMHGKTPGKRVTSLRPDMPVTLVEDTVTTGGSVMRAVEALATEGFKVTQIVSLVDRRDGAGPLQPRSMSSLCDSGIPFTSLWSLGEIVKASHRAKVVSRLSIAAKAGAPDVCVAADVHTVEELKAVLDDVAGSATVVKVHADLFPRHEFDEVVKVLNAVRACGTLVWDDRKFADIGKVVAQQVEEVATYADMVTVVPSVSLAEHVSYFPLIALGHMTTWSHPSREMEAVVEAGLGKAFVGVVLSPSATENPIRGAPVFMPGVKVGTASTDGRGQRYGEVGSVLPDFAVVGRAIVNAEDRRGAVERVRAYLGSTAAVSDLSK